MDIPALTPRLTENKKSWPLLPVYVLQEVPNFDHPLVDGAEAVVNGVDQRYKTTDYHQEFDIDSIEVHPSPLPSG